LSFPRGDLPAGTVEYEVKQAENQVEMYTIEHEISLAKDKVLKEKFSISAGQSIVVHIRASYDIEFFKAGSPFKWCLDNIRYIFLHESAIELPQTRLTASQNDRMGP
jgi:hypothetical protein